MGLAFLDRELRFRFVSNALITLSGLPGTSYEGRSTGEVWPGLAPGLAPLLSLALEGEQVVGARVSGLLGSQAGKSVRHFRVSVLPASSGGLRSGVGLMLEDETERVEQELALRGSEERLRDLVAVSCDGFFLHEAGLILEASRPLASLLGSTPEEMVGQPVARWVAPESREAVQRILSRQLESPYELTGLRSDGKRLFLEVLGRQVEYAGRIVRMAAVWDISARKASEEAAARADAFREQLLGVVGHDLRAPLQAIQLSVGTLQRGGGLNESQERQVTHLATATKRMERMIHELLDFTRARLAGGLPMHPVPLSLDKLLERVVKEFHVSHPTRLIVSKVEDDVRGTWDESRLGQLLDNLVGNAVQHSPPDTPVEVRLAGLADGITLTVRNEGPPVPLEERATLFEPFKRGKRASGDGLGLGLYIARQIVVAHGGRISVESGVGQGTRFIVWLPRHAPGA
ncbi:PAS domain-containing sensor histidine kinase [Archangium sp.]|uniref:PAS domain-containing sensor histidine kinase n=1 Tax=Archangium sp. TaxID=1872627 RepID=UPI002D3E27E4|nr:PAS domain-containing sensor histidine kinase [Archangium sp.]HYO56877.1 PAS domain-containing sensor histidine kinase [Archangium sp.]